MPIPTRSLLRPAFLIAFLSLSACSGRAPEPVAAPPEPPKEVVSSLRDETLRQLEGFPVVPAAGGWSLLLDAQALGVEAGALSRHLLDHQVAATPMTGWGGEVADRHLRFVFSNEPVERLALLGERFRAALADARSEVPATVAVPS